VLAAAAAVLAVAQVCCVMLHCKELSHWEGQHTKVVWLDAPGGWKEVAMTV
jgi:hypothetical protein